MKLKFLGTGAAEGVPAMFCNCENCKNIRKLGESEFRTRSQVIIDDCISIDFPPEAYAHSLKYGVNFSLLKYVLVTHSHMDHFYAHDFILRGYKYAEVQQPVLQIYGNSEVHKVFKECTAREMKPDVAQNLSFKEISSYNMFDLDEYKILTVPAQHSKTEDCLLYFIQRGNKGYLHFYDTGRVDERAFEYLAANGAKASAVAFDCTFAERTAGEISRHMGIEDNLEMKNKLLKYGIIDGSAKILITHFSHNCNPTRVHLSELEKKYCVTAVYDGFETEL